MANEQDYSTPIESLNDVQVDSEMASIRSDKDFQKGVGSVIGGNKRAAFLQDRLTALYNKKFPEPESRKAELPDMRSTYDAIVKSGVKTPEEIETIGEEGRQKIIDEESLKEMNAADYELKVLWGNSYNENLSLVHFLTDRIGDENVRQTLIDECGNDVEFLDAFATVAKKLDRIFWKGEGSKYKREKGGETE